MKVFLALINAILLVALVAADNEWGSGTARVFPDRLKGIKNRDLQTGSSMKSSKSSGGSSGGSKSSKSMNVPTVAAPTMMVTPTVGGSGSKSKSKSMSKSGGSKSSKSQSGPPQLPGNDCTDPSIFDPAQFAFIESGAITFGGRGTEDPDTISSATCEELKALNPLMISCCTITVVTPTRRLMDTKSRMLQEDVSEAPSGMPTPVPPAPAPPATIMTQTGAVYAFPQNSQEAMDQQEKQNSDVNQTAETISERTDPNGGGTITETPTASPSTTPSAV